MNQEFKFNESKGLNTKNIKVATVTETTGDQSRTLDFGDIELLPTSNPVRCTAKVYEVNVATGQETQNSIANCDQNTRIHCKITVEPGASFKSITKAFLRIFQELYPEKSILLFDNDLASELGHTFGLDIRNTIYGIRSGKHEYKTGIPEDMSKQEFIEWAMEDIVVSLDENVDIIVSWFVGSKDCRCPITGQINDAILKLIDRYDIVIFDCEFDLKYLNRPIEQTLKHETVWRIALFKALLI